MISSNGPLDLTKAARAASKLGRTVNLALSKSDLTPAGYRLLSYLVTGDTAAKVLAAKLSISRPTVTATLDWLEPRGYVKRSPDSVDRRRVEISITPAGLEALEEADRLVGERLEEVLAYLDPDSRRRVIAALMDLGDALNAYRARGFETEPDTVG